MMRNHTSTRVSRAVLCMIGLIALCSVPALAGTITVCSSGCNYTSIQDAIDNAVDGDTIAVMNGTYYECITIDKPLILQGENPEGTIINGTYTENVVTITADDVKVTGFSITGGRRSEDPKEYPAGIVLDGTSNVFISGCKVTDCYIGIYARNTIALTVNGNEIYSNDVIGIYTHFSDLATIEANTIHDNIRGLQCQEANRMLCLENSIFHNVQNGLYLIYYLDDSILEGNEIRDNCYQDFSHAGDDQYTGAYIEEINNCTIRNNQFVHNGGIALFLSGMKSAVLEGNVMEDNYAGFTYHDEELAPGNSIDASNTIDGVPVLYLEGIADQVITGPAPATIYCISCNNVTIRDLVLTQRNGFGIAVKGGSNIIVWNNTVTNNIFQNILFALVEDSAITGNVVENAVYGSGVIDSENVTVSGNSATGNVFGLGAAGELIDVQLTGNTVLDTDGGISFESVTGDEIECSQNVIQGNRSGQQGVGISFSDSGGIRSHHNTISGFYEAVLINGGSFNSISDSSINDCDYGIQISPLGGTTPEPASNNLITRNAVVTEHSAFFTSASDVLVYGNQIYLNNFSSKQDTEPPSAPENLPAEIGSPVTWGLHRSATLSLGTSAPSSPNEDEGNVFHTDTPVTYKYQDIYFTGYLGNYWNWYNGTDSDGNGVGTTSYPVFLDNTDDYPLVAPVSAYTVGPIPPFYADFTASPIQGSAPLTVQFTDSSNGTPLLWLYTFGDGFTSNAKNPRYTYRTPGNYTVSLTIWKMEGQTLVNTTTRKPAFISVTGTPAPVLAANFTAVPVSGPAPLTVTFTDTSTGDPDYWSYNFGDGTTSSAKNPSHTYRAAGTYTVTLTIIKISSTGLIRDTIVKEDLITVIGEPVPVLTANFTAIPLSGLAPLTVTFTDTSTGDPDYWSYDFGDGTTSSAKNPIHTYRAAGTYTVTLTIMKIGGGGLIRDTTVKQDLITVTGEPVPVLAANFTAVPVSGPVPLKVTFTDTSTGNPQFWNYDFGDGTSSTAKNLSHTYLRPGSYTVTLTVLKLEGSTLIRNTTTRQNLISVG